MVGTTGRPLHNTRGAVKRVIRKFSFRQNQWFNLRQKSVPESTDWKVIGIENTAPLILTPVTPEITEAFGAKHTSRAPCFTTPTTSIISRHSTVPLTRRPWSALQALSQRRSGHPPHFVLKLVVTILGHFRFQASSGQSVKRKFQAQHAFA
jgi:hypothetical protein